MLYFRYHINIYRASDINGFFFKALKIFDIIIIIIIIMIHLLGQCAQLLLA